MWSLEKGGVCVASGTKPLEELSQARAWCVLYAIQVFRVSASSKQLLKVSVSEDLKVFHVFRNLVENVATSWKKVVANCSLLVSPISSKTHKRIMELYFLVLEFFRCCVSDMYFLTPRVVDE